MLAKLITILFQIYMFPTLNWLFLGFIFLMSSVNWCYLLIIIILDQSITYLSIFNLHRRKCRVFICHRLILLNGITDIEELKIVKSAWRCFTDNYTTYTKWL